jgi:hypothetical protein
LEHPVPQVPAWQTREAPQEVPSASFGWAQLPCGSQLSPVQGLPSSSQGEPAARLDQAVLLLAGSHTAQASSGLAASAW